MNMQVKPTRTPAETALVEAFAERLTLLPGDAATTGKRDDAIETIKTGLPTRRVEAWHYTDFRRLLTSIPAFDASKVAKPVEALLAGASVLPILNGVSGKRIAAVDGVTVQRLEEKLQDGSFAPALDLRGADDAVGAINTAFVADGFFLDIAAGAAPEHAIELQNIHDGGQVHVRLPVRVGDGAKATIVERQTGAGAALVSSISHLAMGENSEITWIIVQQQPETATHLGQFNAEIGKNAKLTLFVMNAGGKLVRQEIRVTAKGEGGSFTLRAISRVHGRP